MLVIKPRAQGAGLVDIISKVANSALAKKVVNSAVGKKVIEKATKENFKKAANSVLGKQLQSAVVKGVADASEKAANSAFQKLGISTEPGLVAKTSEKAVNSALQNLGIQEKIALDKVFNDTLPPPSRKRKVQRPGRKKGKKRRAFGTGIILE